MIVVDTNMLIALVDPNDALHVAAKADFKRLNRTEQPFGVTSAVLTEAFHLLSARSARDRSLHRRLMQLLLGLPIVALEPAPELRQDVLAWFERYEDNRPDYCDAQLVCLVASDPALSLWTHDREFTQGRWLTLDGKPVTLALKARAQRR